MVPPQLDLIFLGVWGSPAKGKGKKLLCGESASYVEGGATEESHPLWTQLGEKKLDKNRCTILVLQFPWLRDKPNVVFKAITVLLPLALAN